MKKFLFKKSGRFYGTGWILWLVILLNFFVMPAAAQDTPPAGPPPAAPAKRGEVSFNFDDADVYSVIQTIFGGVLRVNHIIDPKVKGRVNFRSVAPVAKEEVLPLMEVILRLNGIGVIEESGLYRIIPMADMPREPAPIGMGREADKVPITGLGLLQVVPLKFIPSAEMVRVLTPFLSTNAVVVEVPKINYLIVVDTDANVKRLLKLVEIFDSEQLRQALPQVFVYPVQNGKAKDLAPLLAQIFLGSKAPVLSGTSPAHTAFPQRPSPPVSVPTPTPAQPAYAKSSGASAAELLVSENTRIFPDELTNSLVILATPEDYTRLLETIKKLDRIPRQVMIEALIAEVTLADELKLGVEWSLRGKMDKGFFTTGFDSANIDSGKPAGFSFLGLDRFGQFQTFLQALALDSKLSVLASPHIMASDNREARIQIGDQIPVVTSETNVSGTTNIQRTIQYKDTGTILKIKPQINDSGMVNLEISQEVSDYRIKQLYGSEYPVIFKREAVTSMVCHDGQSLVIGGLIRNKSDKTREGIPLLSRIPLLGYLFGYTSEEKTNTEIVVVLTPRVVRNPEEAEKVNAYYLHRLGGVEKEVLRMMPKSGEPGKAGE